MASRSFQSVVSTTSILQFNTLADALSDAFPHVEDKELVLSWKNREARIHAVLAEHDHDFICLEEVDHFGDSFFPFLASRGYDGVFAVRRPATHVKTSRDGVALFWKRDKYTLVEKWELLRDTKCFGIVARFTRPNRTSIVVAAVHLTAKPGMEAFRQEEVLILLNIIDRHDHPVLIGGDFNDVPDSLACQMMRDAGFVSAYTHDEDSWTTWKKREKEVKRVIDYIWHRGHIITIAVLPVDFPRILPDEHYPSDHMAIAAQVAFARKW